MVLFFRMDLPDLRLLTQGGGKMPRQLNLKFAEYCREMASSGLLLMDSRKAQPVWLIYLRSGPLRKLVV